MEIPIAVSYVAYYVQRNVQYMRWNNAAANAVARPVDIPGCYQGDGGL